MRIHGIDGKGSTLLSGSLSISGSVTAQGFNIDDTAVGTPALYSSTNLNLSASNAVVVTSSPLRLVSLTNAQTGSFTGQDGDIIFNSTRASYMAYSGSDWQDVIINGMAPEFSGLTVDGTISGSLVDSPIKETRAGDGLSFWSGTQAQYDALGSYDSNTIYFVT